ncbi:hypothetical protein [Rhizobium sp. BR 362]|uniref:hypothetical protein n=1 Tax=Rhizobium sp. BR 362 TaxID=3040670 RepID=UPI002F3FA51A
MTWCDKLASQPSVGFQLDPFYGGGEAILTKLAALMMTWGTPEQPEFVVTPQPQDVFRVDIQRENGFLYSFDALKASVQFQHRMQLKAISGGLPVAQLISSPKVFSSLLSDATEMLIESTLLLPEAGRRHVMRVGVVSTTTVSEDDLPPGILRFIEYLGRPWAGKLEGFNMALTATVHEDENVRERCIHRIAKAEEEDGLLTIVFDWQRFLKKKIPVTRRELERACQATQKTALEYFEELAIGNAFDETA